MAGCGVRWLGRGTCGHSGLAPLPPLRQYGTDARPPAHLPSHPFTALWKTHARLHPHTSLPQVVKKGASEGDAAAGGAPGSPRSGSVTARPAAARSRSRLSLAAPGAAQLPGVKEVDEEGEGAGEEGAGATSRGPQQLGASTSTSGQASFSQQNPEDGGGGGGGGNTPRAGRPLAASRRDSQGAALLRRRDSVARLAGVRDALRATMNRKEQDGKIVKVCVWGGGAL